MCPFKINIDFMKSTNPKITHKQKEQSNPSQPNNEKQLVPANDFQKFFKLEFDSLNYFVDQEMSKLKEEFESELMNSKSLLNKYRNLRRLCDKKLEFDQFKLWNDNHNYHHSKEREPIDSYHQKSRSENSHHISHTDQRYSSSHMSKYYYDDYPRSRNKSPEYDERRYFNPRMVRDLPSSQRKGISKRTYQDDLKRIEKIKAQNLHRNKSSNNH